MEKKFKVKFDGTALCLLLFLLYIIISYSAYSMQGAYLEKVETELFEVRDERDSLIDILRSLHEGTPLPTSGHETMGGL